MTRSHLEFAALLASITLIVVIAVWWIAHIDQSNCIRERVSFDHGQFLIGDRCVGKSR